VAVAVFVASLGANAAFAALTFPLQSKWSASLSDVPRFAPAYDAGFGYFLLRNDQLVALSLADGSEAWSVACKTTAAPVAGNGLVFTGGETIESRSQKDGTVSWTRPIEGRLSSLYWDTGWLFAVVDKGAFMAIRAADGEVLWRRDLGAPLHSSPALAGDRVYVALEDGQIVALKLQTGEPLWTYKLGGPGVGILALEQRLFVGSLDDYMYCLDTKSGKRAWRKLNDADIVGAPVLDARRVYFVALDNLLRALNRGGGSLYWKRSLPMRPSSGPLLIGTLLVVPGFTASLQAYSTRDGSTAGTYELRGSQGEELQLAAPPYLGADDTIVIVTRNGQVQALASAPAAPATPAAPAAPAAPGAPPATGTPPSP
jgi:outer membrane protein assembly factor BamB